MSDGGAKLSTLGACTPDKTTATLATGEGYLHGSGWASDVARVYLSSAQSPFKLIRYDPETGGYSVYTASSGYYGSYDLQIVGSQVFVLSLGPNANTAYVHLFNTSSDPPTLVATYSYAGLDGYPYKITSDGTYLYVGTSGAKVLLIKIADMGLKDTLTLYGSSIGIRSLDYNPYDGKVYSASGTPGIVWKILRSGETLSMIAQHTVGLGGLTGIEFDSAHAYVWVGIEGTSPGGQVLRIPWVAFNSHEVMTVGPPGEPCWDMLSDSDGTHIWVMWPGTPAQLTRINTSDLTTDRIWLGSGENDGNEFVQYGTGKYLAICWLNPAKIVNLTNPFCTSAIEKPSSGSLTAADIAASRDIFVNDERAQQLLNGHAYSMSDDGNSVFYWPTSTPTGP